MPTASHLRLVAQRIAAVAIAVATLDAAVCVHAGDDIVLTVVAVEGNKVRLGIQAPRSARVLRGELLTRPESPSAETCLVVDVAPGTAAG